MKEAQNSCKESIIFGQFNYLPLLQKSLSSGQRMEQKEHTVKKETLGFWTASRPLLLQQLQFFLSNENQKDFALVYRRSH